MQAPAKIADVIAVMDSPLCTAWTWTRREGRHGAILTVFHDDMERDTRTVIEVGERPGTAPVIHTTTVQGYDPKRHAWTGEQMRRTKYAPDRKGWSALVAKVKEQAIASTGYPNPLHVHYDRTTA